MHARIKNHLLAFRAFIFMMAMAGLTISPPLPADDPPENIFGNYVGAGKCPPGAPKPCTDTGTLDNLFIQRFDKAESDMEKQAREFHGIPKADSRIAVRILRDHGHSCAFEGEAVWVGDHLAFKDEPPPARTVYSRCDLQLWFKDGVVAMRDPRNECTCSGGEGRQGERRQLEGRRFIQGPDRLLATPKKSDTPPPANIFGKFIGTGQCAKDERKSEVCKENKSTDYIVIEPSDKADARVTVASTKRTGENEDYFCLREADAAWFGNHLAFVMEMPDKPGRPHLVEFWFKNGTVVVHPLRNDHCGRSFRGTLFRKPPAQPNRDAKQ